MDSSSMLTKTALPNMSNYRNAVFGTGDSLSLLLKGFCLEVNFQNYFVATPSQSQTALSNFEPEAEQHA